MLNKLKEQHLNPLSIARYSGNILNIVGYFVVINVDSLLGSTIKILGLALCIPFCAKIKLWDVIAVFTFFIVIDLHNIFTILGLI